MTGHELTALRLLDFGFTFPAFDDVMPVLAGRGWITRCDADGWRVTGAGRLAMRGLRRDPAGVVKLTFCHRCGEPVTGTPVTADDDPLHRQFCTGECRDAAAESSCEQRYQPGVAT